MGSPNLTFVVSAHLFRVLQAVFDRLRLLGGNEFFGLYDIDRVVLRLSDADFPFHIAVLITIGHREIMLSVGSEPFDLPTDIFMAEITAAACNFFVGQSFCLVRELSGDVFGVVVKYDLYLFLPGFGLDESVEGVVFQGALVSDLCQYFSGVIGIAESPVKGNVFLDL